MARNLTNTALLAAALMVAALSSPTYAWDCPVDGTARSPDVRALNHLKNRTAMPTQSDIDPAVTLKAMVAPGNDRSRWSTRRAVVIEGYVANVMVGGVETVNCGARKPADRDTHIELTLDPRNDSESRHVIVEVTPRIRAAMAAQGKDWSTDALRSLIGHRVRVTGWLLFDREHATESANTADPAKVWRATAWELHPVTAIEVLAGK